MTDIHLLPAEEHVVTFHNVTIAIAGADPRAAYERVCALLDIGATEGWLEYTTDTFDVDGAGGNDTSELFDA